MTNIYLKKNIYNLLFWITAIFFIQPASASDLLDSVKSNSKLIRDLKDVYRAYKVNHILSDQKENINLVANEADSLALNDLLEYNVGVCRKLSNQNIYHDSLENLLEEYIAVTIRSYRMMKEKGATSKAFANDYEFYKRKRDTYRAFLARNYALNRFVSLKEDDYWKTMDKKNYIRQKEYADYEAKKNENLIGSLKLLETLIKKTVDFQERSIYKIELGDQHVKHFDTLEDAHEKAFEIYKSVLDEKKYGLYLFESWLKWRTVLQFTKGASKSAEIPNDEYDAVREQEAAFILDYISSHESDEMAVNQFLLFATHDIVRRFGDYGYGNQNAIEYEQIFGDKK